MADLFFDHLVIREEIDFVLNTYTLDEEDRQELLQIIDTLLTHQVLNVILNHLPDGKHTEFMTAFRDSPADDGLIDYLKIHAHPRIEAKIKSHAAKIKSEILSEIRKSVQKKHK